MKAMRATGKPEAIGSAFSMSASYPASRQRRGQGRRRAPARVQQRLVPRPAAQGRVPGRLRRAGEGARSAWTSVPATWRRCKDDARLHRHQPLPARDRRQRRRSDRNLGIAPAPRPRPAHALQLGGLAGAIYQMIMRIDARLRPPADLHHRERLLVPDGARRRRPRARPGAHRLLQRLHRPGRPRASTKAATCAATTSGR